jgi:8-oxo-dGTP diphosphatase
MLKCELTTMVMIQDPTTGKVLVQERVKSWKGYAFPGGHRRMEYR